MAYFLTKTATATDLHLWVTQGLSMLSDAGLDVPFLLCDGGASNRSFFNVTKRMSVLYRRRCPARADSRRAERAGVRCAICGICVHQSLQRAPGAPSHQAVCPATGRTLYIISDPVHLFKKLRNQLLCSYSAGDKRAKRSMTFGGKDLVWSHIIALYNEERARSATAAPYRVRTLT